MPSLKEIAEQVRETENVIRIKEDQVRFEVYNGRLRDAIKEAIHKEFKLPETINELVNRIVPINITQKIVNKQAMLYMQPPQRRPVDKNPADQELLDLYSKSFKMDRKGRQSNRLFKLHKHTLWEPFLDREGIPRLRCLPSQTYTPLSFDPVQPDKPTHIVKNLIEDQDERKKRMAVWSDEEFVVIDGEGTIDVQQMQELNNPEGVNPFGVLPFTYIAENDDNMLIPISDDDLISVQIVLNILLTDVAFANKYQLWSLLVLEGMTETSNITFNPNSVIGLPAGVTLNAIKPNVDTEKVLAFSKELVESLLVTKNLSTGSGMTADATSQSGIAKMIDRSELTEDRLDQESFYVDAEREHWDKFAHNILPVWVASGQVNPEFVGKFSDAFELSIQFADPKPAISDEQTIKQEEMKVAAGFSTHKMAVQNVNPNLDDSEIDQLLADIEKEKVDRIAFMQRNMAPVGREEGEDQDDGVNSEA